MLNEQKVRDMNIDEIINVSGLSVSVSRRLTAKINQAFGFNNPFISYRFDTEGARGISTFASDLSSPCVLFRFDYRAHDRFRAVLFPV